jgi:hypothetical protein
MEKQIFNTTNDKMIRLALRTILDKDKEKYRKKGHNAEVFEELGVSHGTARIDFAIINGIMHGYEIKSDRDTLKRLPEQVKEFSAVFDKMTLVVGKRYLYQAIHMVPEWWGIIVAKSDTDNKIVFQVIRKPVINKDQQEEISIARLLWREEALQILERQNKADGIRHKPREVIYNKLVDVLDLKALKQTVSELLVSREGWRSDLQLVTSGD